MRISDDQIFGLIGNQRFSMRSIPNTAYRRNQCTCWKVSADEVIKPTSRCWSPKCPNLAVLSVSKLTLPYGLRALLSTAGNVRVADDRQMFPSALIGSAFHHAINTVAQIYVMVRQVATAWGHRRRTPNDKEGVFRQKQNETEKAAQVLDKTRWKPINDSPEPQTTEALQWH